MNHGFDTGELGEASGSAPNPYNETNQALGLGLDSPLLSKHFGLLNGSASSNVDGQSATGSATASGSLASFDFSFAGLAISATKLGSTSSVSGGYGSLDAQGSSTLGGLSISAFGQTLDIPIDAPANTDLGLGIPGLGGIELTLNQQTIHNDEPGSASIETNALVLSLNQSGLLGSLKKGTLVFGHSEAALNAVDDGDNGDNNGDDGDDSGDDSGGGTAVPAPSGLAMLLFTGIGAVGAGVARRRKNKGEGCNLAA